MVKRASVHNQLLSFLLVDGNITNERYEVPVPVTWNQTSIQAEEQKLRFELTINQYNQVGLRVRRRRMSTNNSISDDDPILFDTTYFPEGFIYEDQFLQFITTLPSHNVYGN